MKKKTATSNARCLSLVLVGTIIGAGFASGAEIVAYFVKYGEAGLWSMALAGMLFFLGIYSTLKIAYEHGITEYGTFTEIIAGKWPGAILDAFVSFSMLLGYGVMLAGSGAIFLQQWDIPEVCGALLMAIGTIITLCLGPKGIMAVNRFLTPILVAGIFLLSFYSIWTAVSTTETVGLILQPLSIFTVQPMENMGAALGSAVIYASYNMLGASAILVSLAGYVKNRHDAAAVGGIAALILVVLTFVMGLATFLNYDTIVDIPIPALELLRNQLFWQRLYVGVLLGAMFTTAVSDGYGFISRMRMIWPISQTWLCLATTVVALMLSGLGFDKLVIKGYRFFGYLGIGQLVLIVWKCIPKGEHKWKTKTKKEKTGIIGSTPPMRNRNKIYLRDWKNRLSRKMTK